MLKLGPGVAISCVCPTIAGSGLNALHQWESPNLVEAQGRPLVLGRARPIALDHSGDVDLFQYDLPAEQELTVRMWIPEGMRRVALVDRTTQQERWNRVWNAGLQEETVQFDRPLSLRAAVQPWSGAVGPATGWFALSSPDQPLQVEQVTLAVDPWRPQRVTFSRKNLEGIPGVERIRIDADGDGRFDGEIPAGASYLHRYAAEGLYRARIEHLVGDRITAEERRWVDATGPAERRGLRLTLVGLGEGAEVSGPQPIRARPYSYEGLRINRVVAQINGRSVAQAVAAPWELTIPWDRLPAGPLAVRVIAVDARGNQAVVERSVQRSPFYGLTPADGSRTTGETMVMRWRGDGPAPAVRYRPAAGGEWTTVAVSATPWRRAVLEGLEAGRPYQVQAMEGAQEGPTRLLTRIKGLTFAKRRYSATVQRDYDQRIPVTMRNDGEEPAMVRLGTVAPDPAAGLLVGFVGPGEAGRPVPLEPGEEREFLFVVSAQGALLEQASCTITLDAEGYHDEAEVDLRVILPKVELEFETLELQPEDDPLLTRLRLYNRGDTLTDLDLGSGTKGFTVSPAIQHGLFKAGQHIDLRVMPILRHGWSAAQGTVRAHAVATTVEHEVAASLASGEQVYAIDLRAGGSQPNSAAAGRHRAAAAVAAWLDPAQVDWHARRGIGDLDGDGRPDRWEVDDALDDLRWSGDDLDGDGSVDHVRVDVGRDSVVDAAWQRAEDGSWRGTNIAEAWVEMGFDLPNGRETPIEHSLSILVGGSRVGGFEDAIPEGNYRWPVPLDRLPFDDQGHGDEGAVQVRTKRLTGGHYVIGRDLRFHVRALGGQVFAAGPNEAAARQRLLQRDALLLDRVDLSCSGSDLALGGAREAGSVLTVSGRVDSLAAHPQAVTVALVRQDGDGRTVELDRGRFPLVNGSAAVQLAWRAAAGRHALALQVDPDGELSDVDPGNNSATIPVQISGDNPPPSIAFSEQDGVVQQGDGVILVQALAEDDGPGLGVEVSVDGGLAQDLSPDGNGRFAARVLLTPGSHQLTLRARDAGGQIAEASRQIDVVGTPPAVAFLGFTDGQEISAGTQGIIVAAASAKRVALRINQGPWNPISQTAIGWQGRVDLPAGPHRIEALAVDGSGQRATAQLTLQVKPPPEEQEDEAPTEPQVQPDPDAPSGPIDVPGVGPVDPLAKLPPVVPPKGKRQGPVTGSGGLPGGSSPPAPGGGGRAPSGTGGGFMPTDADPWSGKTPQASEPGSNATEQDSSDQAEPTEPVAEPTPQDAASLPSAVSSNWQGPGYRRPAGLGVKVQQHNHHCTNRQQIDMKFRLPGWLKNIDLSKVDPNSEEFKKMVAERLKTLKDKGYDTKHLEKMMQLLGKRIGRLDQADGRIPGWLESIGAVDPPPSDPEKLAEWRKGMLAKARIWYLRLLHSGDPELVAKGLRARAELYGQFDEAFAEQANAAADVVKAHQQVIQDVAESLPYVGEAMDVVALATGETLSGDKVTAFDAVFRLLSVGPEAATTLMKHSASARKAVAKLAEIGGSMSAAAKARLAKALGYADPKQVEKAIDNAKAGVAALRKGDADELNDVLSKASKEFDVGDLGKADAKLIADSKKEAKELLEKLKNADPGTDEFRRLANQWQANKTAQAMVVGKNADQAGKALVDKLQDQIGKNYDKVDDAVKTDIGMLWKQDPATSKQVAAAMGVDAKDAERFREQVEALAKKHGVDPQDIKVDVWNPTNSPGSLGRDRDVTYILKGPDGRVLGDIDHAITKGPYEQNFWKVTRESSDIPRLPDGRPDTQAIAKWASKNDQMVTSAKHLEAYNTGEVALKEFLDKGKTPTLTRIEDLRDTMVYKSDHWFDAAKKAQDPIQKSRDIAEGMRQATKQWDNMVVKRMSQYGVDAGAVPLRLQNSVDILKKVDAGSISPAKAEHLLEAMGSSKEKAVRDMATYLEGLEKGAGAAWRRTQASGVVDRIARDVSDVGGPKWLERNLKRVNTSLSQGKLSPQQFSKIRGDIMLKRVTGKMTPQAAQRMLRKGVINRLEYDGILRQIAAANK